MATIADFIKRLFVPAQEEKVQVETKQPVQPSIVNLDIMKYNDVIFTVEGTRTIRTSGNIEHKELLLHGTDNTRLSLYIMPSKDEGSDLHVILYDSEMLGFDTERGQALSKLLESPDGMFLPLGGPDGPEYSLSPANDGIDYPMHGFVTENHNIKGLQTREIDWWILTFDDEQSSELEPANEFVMIEQNYHDGMFTIRYGYSISSDMIS